MFKSISINVFFTTVLTLFCSNVHATESGKVYGQDFEASAPKSIDWLLDSTKETQKSEEVLGKDLVVQAKIDKVCESKGCWFETKSSKGESIRVTFKDYGFFIPKESLGKTITMQGQLIEKTLSVKTQRHYLKDAKAPQKEIDAVTAPKSVYQFVASGLKI